MTYTDIDFRTKKELKDAVAKGEKITIFNPGLSIAPVNGTAYLEGPHYPRPHTWYAVAEIKDGIVIKVK